jgi:protein-S-isoprenylcysteine O-methyltransferase Ste14
MEAMPHLRDPVRRRRRRLVPRLLALLLVSIPIFLHQEFYQSLRYYSPSNLGIAFTEGSWALVIVSILGFLAFLIPLSFRRKADWGEYGLVGAFFVSLFIEMYGVPLSIMFVYRHLGLEPIRASVNCIFQFSALGANLCLDYLMAYGLVLMVIGGLLISWAWITLYRQSKRTGMVTEGIYGYCRHPQYLGFIMIVVGWLIGWPSAITLLFAPILVYKYISVCRVEEKEMFEEFPEYEAYRKTVPFLL